MSGTCKGNIIDAVIASGAFVVDFLEHQLLIVLTVVLVVIRIMNGMKEYRKKNEL